MIATYILRVAPALVLGAMMLLLVRRQARLRIVLYLALFVLLRDAMTPLGLWSFGTQGFFWIRLASDTGFLAVFGCSCLGLALGLYYLDRDNRPLVQWIRGSVPVGFFWGIGGMILVVAPLAAIYQFTAIEFRGGPVPYHVLPAILVFALLGNLLEETLFRGYVFGSLAEQMTPLMAGISSGVVFAFCHIFLASTVSGIGFPLLAFTMWEGIIAGIVGSKSGVLFSTITHGGTIFLLSSGLI
jgi:membrane protease YdiL (CAAX protease family)